MDIKDVQFAVGFIFEDTAAVYAFMNWVASEGGIRTGKQLCDHRDLSRGSSRIVKVCVNPDCMLRLWFKKKHGTTNFVLDHDHSITEHYCVGENGLKLPCINSARASQVLFISLFYIIMTFSFYYILL
jgi:hypothetical protein